MNSETSRTEPAKVLFANDGPYRIVLEGESGWPHHFAMVGPGVPFSFHPPFLPYLTFTVANLNDAWLSGSQGQRNAKVIPTHYEFDGEVDLIRTMPNCLRLFDDPEGNFSETHLRHIFSMIHAFMGHRFRWTQEALDQVSEMFVEKFGEPHRAMIKKEFAMYYEREKEYHRIDDRTS